MRIPNTNLDVSHLSMGTGGLGTEIQGDDVFRLLDEYISLGGNLLDSAHVYACWVQGGVGASERAVGEWLRSRRPDVLISTKGGHPSMGDLYQRPSNFLDPELLARDVEESLERLGVDVIDLYYLHRDDGVTPVSEIIDALNDLKGPRYFGASNWSVLRLAEANIYARSAGKRGFVALQNQWSLAVPSWHPTEDPTVRFVTSADRDWCGENKIMIHAYSPTANGYFAGRSEGAYGGSEEIRDRALVLAKRMEKTPTQIALAWLRYQLVWVVPILGTTNVEHLREAFAVRDVWLSLGEVEWLRA